MKFSAINEKKASNNLADKAVTEVLQGNASLLYGFTRREFDKLAEYDVLMIMAFYYYRMNAEQKDVILTGLQENLGLSEMEDVIENLSVMADEDLEDIYIPLSCKLIDRLNDKRITTIVYETLFTLCTEMVVKDWDEDNSFSNYLALLNAAFLRALSYKLHVKRSCSECMQVYYGKDNFDDLIDSLYDKHKEDIYWDVDVDLDAIDEMLDDSIKNDSFDPGTKEEYLDAVEIFSDIQREHATIVNVEDLEGFDLIVFKTDIKECKCIDISGFECHFCQAAFTDEEYIIVYQMDSHINEIVDNTDEWADFQKSIYYEDIKLNLGKAVVYIIYILDDDSDNIPIQLIESNKIYARKYVFTEEETITFINGIVKDSYAEIASLSPVQTWDQILREEHLTGCMTEAYAAKKVEAYLSGERFDADYVLDDDYSSIKHTKVPTIKWVKSLKTAGFRDFCFNKKTLKFGQINLFYGANGSGKTSVLEAIEYALTSEVRRVKDFKVDLPTGNSPRLDVYDNEGSVHIFTPEFSKENKKEIERVWYGVPIGRNKSNLNDNFNRFNAFDSEAAYKFIHESDTSEGNFASMFGNLMFGETVVDHEKKWQRFKAAFNDRYKELKNELNDARYWADIYERSLAQKSISSKSQDVEAGIIDLKFRNALKLPKSSIDRYPQILDEMASVRKYVDALSSYDLESHTFKEIQKEVSETKKNSRNLERQKKQKSEEITKLVEEKGKIKKKIFAEQENQTNIQKRLDGVNTDIRNWSIVENVLSHEDTIRLVNDLLDELTQIEKDLNYISKIEQRPSIINFLKLDNRKKISTTVRGKYEDELTEKKAYNQELENRYNDEKKAFGEREQQAIELRRLGKILTVDAACPLCGHKYNSTKQLLNIIDNAVIIDDKMDALLSEMQAITKRIAELEKILDRENLIDTATRELKELEGLIPAVKECGPNYKKLYDYVFSKPALEKRKTEIVEQQTVLDSQGFSLRNITNCQEYKKTDPSYLEYKKKGTGTYSQFLQKRLESIQREYLLSETTIEKYNQQIKQNDQQQELCQNDIHRFETMIDALDLDENREVEQALENLKTKFELPDSMKLRDWIKKYHQVYDKCEYEVQRLESQNEIKLERDTLAEYRGIIERDEPMLERCAAAVKTFEKMPSLSSFVEQGIKSNIQQISQFFKRMHHSGEFEKLDIDEIGLYAVRGMDNQVVRTYEMSTGQRSTIAMAVMFALHVAAPDAPKFLLLDEPLATMDDTQVLNVLDILKDLADQNTQIFFTTANGVMIDLFRACFKDSTFDYKEFEFIKRVNCPSEIRETTINDTKPIEELTLDDLTLDFHQFAEIRDTLRRNQEKLLSKEERDNFSQKSDPNKISNTEDLTDIDSTLFYNLLTNEERQLMDDLVMNHFKRAPSLSELFILTDINEKASKYFGRKILNTDEEVPFIYNWYQSMLKIQHDIYYYEHA